MKLEHVALGVGACGLAYLAARKAATVDFAALGIDAVDVSLTEMSPELESFRPALMGLLHQRWPFLYVTSANRSLVENSSLDGASPNSRHLRGLAIDVGGFAGNYELCLDAARWIRANAKSLPGLRTVIAERTPIHLHVDIYGASEAPQAARYFQEATSQQDVWERLS